MAHSPPGPIPRALLPFLGLLAGLLVSCATAPAPPENPRESNARDGGRGVLAKTTPRAAAVADRTDEGATAQQRGAPPSENATPGRLLIYSAITGHVPLDEQDPDDPTARYRTPAEREAARTAKIEAEIEAELAKEEALSFDPEVELAPPAPKPSAAPFDPKANPLSAPPAPALRNLPESLFDTRTISIPAGQWQNRRELQLVRKRLDVDGDGAPEEIRYEDPNSGQTVRVERDTDFDGTLDDWVTYEQGTPVIRVRDTNANGASDSWERFTNETLQAKTLDQDHDGVKDTFFRYAGGELTELLRDANNDGTIDRVERYSGRRRTRTEEDRTLNGFMDTWTEYRVVGDTEVVASVERDTHDVGKPNVFETYETSEELTRLTRKEEDLDADGTIDVVSIYENGRLKQRAISDEALSPL